MSNYRRANFPGGYYFFTVVTYSRKNLFNQEFARNCLHSAWQQTNYKRPFDAIALCLLPDHLHCVWKLPDGDADFSIRWSSIKALFTREYSKQAGNSIENKSRIKHREAMIWQRRFWEHQIRDETDLQNHINYIHYNPVKHNLVTNVSDWPWSTYHKFAKQNKCSIIEIKYKIPTDINFGE
ncbi:MAG: Transposase IS200 like protein [Planctomycetes bacterium ADurb.Bin401]|nr:MAG: Transposase IS200 like protein [Planctomycetes bacterium ADurb.Bin401]